MMPKTKMTLIEPYGGKLKNLLVTPEERIELKTYAGTLPSIRLSRRSICDLELLATGAFSPLDRFMNQADYCRVLKEMRLADGHIFPIPVTLPVKPENKIRENSGLALRDEKNNLLAVMNVEEVYKWDAAEFAERILATGSSNHPLAGEIATWGSLNISGRVRVIDLPRYYDFPQLRLTPEQTRRHLEALGSETVVAFQTRNPLHRAHEELTRRAMESTGGTLLLHPAVGLTREGDIDHYSRVRTYKTVTEKYYPKNRVLLALLPLAMRFAGPREALWHAIIRRNYGADHFIVGRDHAGAGVDEDGRAFYAPDAARELVEKFSTEIGVRVTSFGEFGYLPETASYGEIPETSSAKSFFKLSGTEIREQYLNKGVALPDWFARPEIARILEDTYPPRDRQGVCLWFTGLSGSGKSTIAEILTARLTADGRRVTLLDGDVVRAHLCAGLGFDKAGRDANVRRIGYVASEIVRHGGVAVCAAISPYRSVRDEIRAQIGENFVEIYMGTPLAVCEERDPKGLYAKARRGEIKEFTGIDDVYEPPPAPEITLGTVEEIPEDCAQLILNYLLQEKFIRVSDQ